MAESRSAPREPQGLSIVAHGESAFDIRSPSPLPYLLPTAHGYSQRRTLPMTDCPHEHEPDTGRQTFRDIIREETDGGRDLVRFLTNAMFDERYMFKDEPWNYMYTVHGDTIKANTFATDGHDPSANGYDRLRTTRVLYDRGFGKVTRNTPRTPPQGSERPPKSEESNNHTNHSSDNNRPVARLEQKLDDALGPPQSPDKQQCGATPPTRLDEPGYTPDAPDSSRPPLASPSPPTTPSDTSAAGSPFPSTPASTNRTSTAPSSTAPTKTGASSTAPTPSAPAASKVRLGDLQSRYAQHQRTQAVQGRSAHP